MTFVLAEVGEAGDDRLVVADGAVAVQLDELVEDQVEVVAGLGPASRWRETWTVCQGSRLA